MPGGDATPLWIVILSAIGGGTVVTILGPIVRIPRELDEHDLRIVTLNADGGRWIANTERRIERARYEIGNQANALPAGHWVAARQNVVFEAGEALRDEVVRGEQEHDLIVKVLERRWHRGWRWLFRGGRPCPPLTFRAEASRALYRWRRGENELSIRMDGVSPTWPSNDLLDA